jgi:hypothetical protein
MRGQIACSSIKLVAAAFSLGILTVGAADFIPLPLTLDSYNQDIVVEKTASPPIVPVTTASMDGGLANNNFTWYECGFSPVWPASGLPKAGSRRDSEAVGDHEYQFAPSYKENNAVLIDATVTNATFTVIEPAAYVTLSFLISGGNGGGKIAYTIHHQNGANQNGSFLCYDWINGPNAAYTSAGRINISTFAFEMDPGNPRLYASDVSLAHTSSPVTSIDFAYVSGAGHQVVFAVSGCSGAGQPFTPIPVTGYNQDLVVEASSTCPGFLAGFTTAAMDDGPANSGNTWYEQGYYPPFPATGLPPAGATIISASAPDHRYTLAPSYTNYNVILVDAINSKANITPVTAARFARLSFLASAGHGPVTNQCIVQHLDGSSETNRFIAPDWFDTRSRAFTASGTVQLSRRLVGSLSMNGPSLFAADFDLVNTTSPITNLVVTYAGGGLNSHAVIFAVSGSDVSAPPVTAATLSLHADANGWVLGSSSPGRLQSTTVLDGDRTIWKEEGQISATVTVNPTPTEPARFYRVVSP